MKFNIHSCVPALSIALASFFCLTCNGKKDYLSDISKDPTVHDEKDMEAVRHLMSITEIGKRTELNFANDLHYRFYKKLLYQSGLTMETSPQLFKVLEARREEHLRQASASVRESQHNGVFKLASLLQDPADTVTVPIEEITSFSSTSQTEYTTSALLSFPETLGAITATLQVGLYNQSGAIIGAPGSTSAYYPQKFADLQVASKGTITSAYDSIYSMFVYFYQLQDGSTHHYVKKALTADVVDKIVNQKPMTCTLGQPVPGCGSATCTQKGTSIITVCMARQTPDCNYCNAGFADKLMFPLQGYVKYKGNVNVGPNGKPAGGFYSITLTRLPAGGGCPAIPVSGNFWDYVTVTNDSLSWNISQSLFENNCLVSGDSVLFQLTIFVMVGAEPAFATITNAKNAQKPAIKIPPIQIVSGCLAEGTIITMANGKKKKIETVEIGEKILSDKKKTPLTVDYSTIGKEFKPCLRIADSKKNSILVTDAHPLVTPTGVLLAKDLKVGDKVITEDGDTEIVSITKEQYAGQVWNLSVGKEEDGQSLDFTNTTFFANGFLVGDHKMQSHHLYDPDLTTEDILKALPSEWHKDFLNAEKRKQ